jgi:DNA-binding LacI/PurR family transcriptional regulator
MATIRDVAQAAGVSLQTVSNVIHEKPFVRAEVQQRVRQAIAELNYHPSKAAQTMRRQSSRTLGYFVADPNPRGLADPYYGEVLAGLCEVTRAHDYSLQIEWLDSSQPLQAEAFLKPWRTRQIDAAILFLPGAAGAHDELLTALVAAGAPFAIVEQPAPAGAAYSLLVANYEGAYTATKTLIEAGHRRIAFVDSVQRWPNIDQRGQGYAAALRAASLAQSILTFSSPDWTAEGGMQATEQLLAHTPRPTAILAASDMLAVGAMFCLKQYGLRIPADMALIGFDDWEFTRYLDPPLSTIRLPAQQLGRQAAQLLIDHLQGRPPAQRQVVLPTELVLRSST